MYKHNVNLYYIDKLNAGDVFAKFLVENLVEATVTQTDPGNSISTNAFQITGSIASDATYESIILGTGIILKDKRVKTFKECHIVRGKYTLKRIEELGRSVSPKLGDPGLCLGFFIDHKPVKKYDIGIILHYVDAAHIHKYFSPACLSSALIINVLNADITAFAAQMLLCKRIISSSLHGIIFSHALNIPVTWIRFQETTLPLDDIKFHDYLSAFDLENQPWCQVLTPNVLLSKQQVLDLKTINIPIEALTLKQNELFHTIISTFVKHNFEIKKRYANNFYDAAASIGHLVNHMQNKFLIGRIGGVELEAYIYYKQHGFNLLNARIIRMFTYCGYYDKAKSAIIFKRFINEFERYYQNATLLLVANNKLTSYLKYVTVGNQYYVNDFSEMKQLFESNVLKTAHIPKMSYDVLESFTYFKEYFQALHDKRILIISPFEKEIRAQLKIKHLLFNKKCALGDFTSFVYPEFRSVEYVNTWLTTNSYQTPHDNIFQTLLTYQAEIAKKDFDIALLICGAYAYPLASFIYERLHKSCIHIGGIGQLFFGIKGGRYMINYFKELMNEHWIYPYTEINTNTNAVGVPDYDGLQGYFKREQ